MKNQQTVKENWVESFFNKLYWELFMKRTQEQIKNEGELILHLINPILNTHSLNKKMTGLDVCCGVADIAQYLSSYINMTGVELSEDYVTEGKLISPQVEIFQDSALNYTTTKTFDVVYNWFSSFAYFENENNIELLKNCFNWTKEDGVFLLEMYNSYAVIKNYKELHTYEKKLGKTIYNIERKSTIDWKSRKLNQLWTIKNEMNESEKNQYNTFTKIYLVDELIELVEKVGFKNVEVYGRNEQGVIEEFSIASPRLIIKAYK